MSVDAGLNRALNPSLPSALSDRLQVQLVRSGPLDPGTVHFSGRRQGWAELRTLQNLIELARVMKTKWEAPACDAGHFKTSVRWSERPEEPAFLKWQEQTAFGAVSQETWLSPGELQALAAWTAQVARQEAAEANRRLRLIRTLSTLRHQPCWHEESSDKEGPWRAGALRDVTGQYWIIYRTNAGGHDGALAVLHADGSGDLSPYSVISGRGDLMRPLPDHTPASWHAELRREQASDRFFGFDARRLEVLETHAARLSARAAGWLLSSPRPPGEPGAPHEVESPSYSQSSPSGQLSDRSLFGL